MIAGNRLFIRLDIVDDVQKVAEEGSATEMRNYCEEYRICNAEGVLLAHGHSGRPNQSGFPGIMQKEGEAYWPVVGYSLVYVQSPQFHVALLSSEQ